MQVLLLLNALLPGITSLLPKNGNTRDKVHISMADLGGFQGFHGTPFSFSCDR